LQHPGSWPRFAPGEDGLSYQNHNPFFVLASDGRYYDLAPEMGLDMSHISRGISTADVDGDGRLDFAIANQWEASYFYRNESPHVGQFLGLHLRLPVGGRQFSRTKVCPGHPTADNASRPAIGAHATLYLPDKRQLVAEVDGGNGHSGKRSHDLQFGLGSLPPNQKLRVVLRWRNQGGVIQQQEIEVSPGWYTVLLGQSEERADDCQK
jgi:hypothetical protein